MTARVLTGSKQEIAHQVANLEGEIRQAIVFVEDPAAELPVPATVEEMFAEMQPYMSDAGGDVDYAREGIYSRKPGE